MRAIAKHEIAHIRHNGQWDVHQCQRGCLYFFTVFARGRRDFEMHGKKLDKPTKAARRYEYTLEQSHRTKTDPYETPYNRNREYGCSGELLVCVTCGSEELVQAQPPLCATCRHKASASETLKRLPVVPADPAISKVLAIIDEAFSTPPPEPSNKCVDTCNNPLECKEEWDRWQGITRGLEDLREGRVKPWSQVREELGI